MLESLSHMSGILSEKRGQLGASPPLCSIPATGDLSSLASHCSQMCPSIHLWDYSLLFGTTTWGWGETVHTQVSRVWPRLKPFEISEVSSMQSTANLCKSTVLLQLVSGLFPKGLCDKGLFATPWKYWGPSGRKEGHWRLAFDGILGSSLFPWGEQTHNPTILQCHRPKSNGPSD